MRAIDADALLKHRRNFGKDYALDPVDKNIDDQLVDLRHIINAPTLDYVPKQQWISVEDRLPEFRDWVLVIGKFVPEGYWIVPHIAEFRNGVWHSDDIDCTPLEECALTVTHWMPLPEEPKED